MKTKLSKLVAVCLTLAMIFGVFSIVPFSASAAEGDASPTVIGDVDGDGEVTVNDATLIQYYLAELATLNDAQKFVADVDDDGDVTVNDATMIQYYLAELVDGFNKQPAPVEDTVYVVAGTENLTGYNWSGSPDTGNVLEKDGDVYSFTFKNVNVIDEEMQFKIVANKEGSDPEWIGDENGHNIGIKLKEACDITITFDPATKKISVSGQSVYEDSDIFLIDSMRIVGAADINKGTWLNGISWNTAADENLMVEVLPDVYRITFYNLPNEMGYEFKFAANGNRNANWGRGDNTEMVLNTPFDASFNAKNFIFDLEEDSNVTITLDLTGFDFATKSGAKVTIDVEPALPVIMPTYVVAGTPNLTGFNWSGSPDTGHVLEMDGSVYRYTFENVDVIDEEMQIKVVENIGTHQYWYGDENDQNICFKVTKETDVTITFDPATSKITVSGDGVEMITELKIDAMRVAGKADEAKGNWLNGVSWAPGEDANLCEEVSPNVYSITFNKLPEEMGYEFKFAANGDWNANWGVDEETDVAINAPINAVYNGSQNVSFDLDEESDVTLTLDLTDFDYATKSGAVITISVTPSEPVYVVAGSANLTGYNWSGSPDTGNVLEEDGDVYSFTFPGVDVLNEEMQIKIVANKQGGNPVWIGDENGQNIAFKVTEVSDVKISFDPATNKITVSGDGVEMITDLVINNIIIAGAADESKGSWLNGVSWDPSAMANIVPMVAPKVYSVKYENLPEEMGYEFKFAVNGTWNANWGIADDTEFEFGTYFDSKFNGSNIKFDLEEKSNVTIVLDLTNFVYATKEGAKINIIVEPVKNYTYVVAGTENLTSYFWSSSVETGNVMTQNEDGTYSFTFKDVAASDEEMQLKIVGIPAEGGDIVWYGVDGTSANVAFYNRMDCDITVTFDPVTKEISVTGEGVELITDLVIDSITVAGSGSKPWLNGISWDPTAVENHMTKIADGIYQIRFENIQSELNYELKFAANDSWGNNWGIPTGASYTPGEWADAVINADNIRFEVEDDLAIVVVTLDLRDFSYTTKQGAKFCIEIIPITEE